jgi:small multidrug resistance pump
MENIYRHFVPFLLLLICAMIGAAGQYLLKTGALLSAQKAAEFWTIWLQPTTILGFAIYFVGGLLYISVLKTVPLSIAYPTIALNTLFVVLIGRLYFKESLSFTQVGGILFIIFGVILLWKA